MSVRISTRSDLQIKNDVLEELQWDARIDATQIGVLVDNGVVTLAGTVSTYAERLSAQEAAFRVAGVLDVANEIVVEVPGSGLRTDADIARAVRWALEWDVRVPQRRIQCSVSEGWVTLKGPVDSWQQREDAEHAVLNLAGVRGLVNEIEVVGPTPRPEDIRTEVMRALERRADRAANRIEVLVHDGKVTLSGAVDSCRERQVAVGAARGTRGVREVDDRLRVDPSI